MNAGDVLHGPCEAHNCKFVIEECESPATKAVQIFPTAGANG